MDCSAQAQTRAVLDTSGLLSGRNNRMAVQQLGLENARMEHVARDQGGDCDRRDSDIGHAISLGLVAAGATVTINYHRNQEAAAETLRQIIDTKACSKCP